jgi:WD40 repeat protein
MPEPRPTAAAVDTLSPSAGQNGRSNPYVGPRALGPGEPIYGRERELLDLRDLLIAERIVLLYSPSGAGKTSLIQAGLIPEMEREEFSVLPLMRVGKNPAATAGNRYLASAMLSLEENRAAGDGSLPVADIARISSFADYLEGIEELLPSGNSKLLIFDQFEEILTVDPLDQEGKAEFFAQVGAVLRNSSRWALFSIREDYVAALDPYTRAVPTRLKSNLRLDLLTPEAARLAIEKPADNQGVSFTPEATSRLIDDLRRVMVRSRAGTFEPRLGPYVEPVHLQVVCSQLWEKPRSNPSKIGVEELATIGDVDSALGEYYAAHVGNVAREAGVKEKAIREWFDRSLITESGIRSDVMWQPGGSEGLNDAAIDALEAVHLVRKEERRDATWLELSHNRLVTPIRTNNARWFEAHLSLLQQQSVLWQRQNRNEALCLRGQALKEAEAWASEHENELAAADREFLRVSREKEDARAAARYWRYAVLAIAGIAITGTLAVIAWVQRTEAVKQREIASARGLSALAYRLLDERLDLATLLAVEATRRVDLPETKNTLLAATLFNPRLISFLHGHQSAIQALAFSADGSRVAVGDYDSRVVIWDVRTHRPIRAYPKFFSDAVRAIAFSPDNKYIAASSVDGSVVLDAVDADVPRRLPAIPDEKGDVWSVAFSPDSALLASADTKGRITIWDVATRTLLPAPPRLVEKELRSVAFSAKGTFLATGDHEGFVIVWQRQNSGWVQVDSFRATSASEEEIKLRGGPRITCVAFHPQDDTLLASGSRDWTVNLRDVAAKRNVAQGTHRGSLNSLAFSPDGNMIVSGAQDATVRLWAVPKENASASASRPLEQIGRPLAGHVGWVLGVAFSPDSHTVASGGVDCEAILWDTSNALSERPEGTTDVATADTVLGLSPGGTQVYAGYPDGHIISHDRVTGAETTLLDHPDKITSIDFSVDGRFMISASSSSSEVEKGRVVVREITSPEHEPRRIDVPRKITFAAVSLDGSCAAVAAADGEVMVYQVDRPDDAPILLTGLGNTVYTVTFSKDGTRVAAGGLEQTAYIWDLAAPGKRSNKVQHNGTIRVAKFSPDGSILATGSRDNTILLSDGITGAQLGPHLTGHRSQVLSLAFRPDSKMLASGSEDRGIVLWDVDKRQPIGPRLIKHVDYVRQLHFIDGGKQLVSASSLNDVISWDLDVSKLEDRSRDRVNRNLTQPEWNAYMEGQPYRRTWKKLPEADDHVAPHQDKAAPR